MRIQINRIPQSGGLKIEESWDAKTLDLNVDRLRFKGAINIAAYAEKGYNNLTLSVNIIACIELSCSRCLENYILSVDKNLKFYYTIERNQIFLQPDSDIREEIILCLPVKPLCSSGCKGLCIGCGRNLNKEKCICNK